MKNKLYAKLLEAISSGPIPKAMLFEVIKQDGHTLLYSMRNTVGEWYPAVPEANGGKRGYIQVHKGKPISFLTSDEVAIKL